MMRVIVMTMTGNRTRRTCPTGILGTLIQLDWQTPASWH